MFVIREVNNPSRILAWGYVSGAGQLVDTIPDGFEEVEIEALPEEFTFIPDEPPPPTLSEILEAKFLEALQSEDAQGLTDLQVGDMFVLKAGLTEMLKFNQIGPAKAKIQEFTVPEALEPWKAELLLMFP